MALVHVFCKYWGITDCQLNFYLVEYGANTDEWI